MNILGKLVLVVAMVAVAATLLLSGGAAAGAAGDRAVGTVPSPGRVSPVDLLLDQPVIALLVVLALGLLVGHFPPAVQLFLVKLGLSLLLADASVKADAELANVFTRHGPALVLMSTVVSLAPLAAGLLVSAGWVRQSLLETLAVLCGGVNATPAYELVSRKADAEEVLVLFTTAYAIAMILTVLATQLLIGVMHGL